MFKKLLLLGIFVLFLLPLGVNAELIYNETMEGVGLPSAWAVTSGTANWDNTPGYKSAESLIATVAGTTTYPAHIDEGIEYNYTWAFNYSVLPAGDDQTILPTNNMRAGISNNGGNRVLRMRYNNGGFTNIYGTYAISAGEWYIAQLAFSQTKGTMWLFNGSSGEELDMIGPVTVDFDAGFPDLKNFNMKTDLELDLFQVLLNEGFTIDQDITAPKINDTNVNNSAPRINGVVNLNATITDESTTALSNIDGFIFAWDNGTGTLVNGSFIDLGGLNIQENVNINKTIEVVAGTTIQYQWFANDTEGNMGNSEILSLLVAGNISPELTVNGNNFFKTDNTTVISLNQSQKSLLNLSFADDISLFGFEINITDPLGNLFFNFSNVSLSGTLDNFSRIINVTGQQGTYDVNILVTDSHTANKIKNYKVNKRLDYLRYEDTITVEAEGAIWSSTTKHKDRYDFEFTYLPIVGPKKKVFFVESTDELTLVEDSGYTAHFVDFKNKKWIDFEGLEGTPKITKINNKRYKVQFNHVGNKVKFNSIGGLNSNVFSYSYYLSNATIDYHIPIADNTIFGQDSIFVSFNVNGNGRNTTKIDLYNSTNNLVQTSTVSNTGTGTYFYNATFTSLTDHNYTINATHTDTNNENKSSLSKTFQNLIITDTLAFTAAPAVNFTLIDEKNGSRVVGTTTGTFTYNGTNPVKTFSLSQTNTDNFTIAVFPSTESILTDYTLAYSATGYQQRNLIVSDAVLTSNTQSTTLFLLKDEDGIFATFRVIDSFGNPLSDVTVTFKQLDDTVLEVRNTDDGGIVTFFVDPDVTYQFEFVKTGFKTSTVNRRVTTSDITTVTMEAETEAQQVSIYAGVTYFFQPTLNVLNNDTLTNFNFNLTSSFWNITGCTLTLSNTSTTLGSSVTSFNGSKCSIGIDFNTGNQSTIISSATYQLNGTFNNTVSAQYKIISTIQGSASLKTFIDDLNSFVAAGFDTFGRFILAIIITFAIVAWASREVANIRNEEEVLIGLTIILVMLFSYIGWLNIPLTSIPVIGDSVLSNDWLNKWIVFILVFLGGGSFIIRKNL